MIVPATLKLKTPLVRRYRTGTGAIIPKKNKVKILRIDFYEEKIYFTKSDNVVLLTGFSNVESMEEFKWPIMKNQH